MAQFKTLVSLETENGPSVRWVTVDFDGKDYGGIETLSVDDDPELSTYLMSPEATGIRRMIFNDMLQLGDIECFNA